MRIIRVKLKAELRPVIVDLCQRFHFNDVPFVEDIYAFCATRGAGLPDDARMAKLITAYAKLGGVGELTVRVLANKRRQVLRKLGANPLFAIHVKAKSHPRIMSEALLGLYYETHRRTRQSQCMTCTFFSSCDFGKSYGDAVTSIHVVKDPNYAAKVHPQCPERPAIDATNIMASAQTAITAMAQDPASLRLDPADGDANKVAEQLPSAMDAAEQIQAKKEMDSATDDESMPLKDDWEVEGPHVLSEEANSAWVGDDIMPYSATNGDPLVKLDMTLVSKISMQSFLLFQLSRVLTSKLIKAHAGKFKPSDTPTADQKTDNIKSLAEVTKILPRELAQDSSVFERKLVGKQLAKRNPQKRESKKHLMYILMDVSGSMNTYVASSGLWRVLTRATLASTFALAISNVIEREQGILYLRCFDNSVSGLVSARTAEEFKAIRRFIVANAFNGGGTNIQCAVTTAAADIKAAANELKDAEIMLITDCGSFFSPENERALVACVGKTVLNTLDIASASHGYELQASQALRRMSDHFFKADGSAQTLDKLVTLVGGKKDPKKGAKS